MKIYAIAGTFALALWVCPAAAGDAVTGTWKTGIDHGGYAYVKIQPCGGDICGIITKTFDTKDNDVASKDVGKRVIWDMKIAGEGQYEGGQILQPATGKIYKSRMKLSGSGLKVDACFGPICAGQTWSRVN